MSAKCMHVLHAALLLCWPALSARIASLEDANETSGGFPLNLAGMDPEILTPELCREIFPYIRADMIFLRKVRRHDPDLFASLFKNSMKGQYTSKLQESVVETGTIEVVFGAVGFGLDGALSIAHDVASWLITGYDWKTWLDTQNRVLQEGENTATPYFGDANMGHLWEAILSVNAIRLTPSGSEAIPVFTESDGPAEEYTLPAGTVLTPIGAAEIAGMEKAVRVAWEDDGWREGWVRESDVSPSLYMATETIDIKDGPSVGSGTRQTLQNGEIFAVSRNLLAPDGVRWLELSDGRGYFPRDSGYVQTHRESTKPEGSWALQGAYQAHKSVEARVGRLAFNVGMFTAGFFTGGATWAFAGAVGVVDGAASTALEHRAMSDIAVKTELVMARLRAWELTTIMHGTRCSVATMEGMCSEGYACERDFVFHEAPLGPYGEGRCVPKDTRPVREEGEECLVHADCMLGNCQVPPDCVGDECLVSVCMALG